MSELNGRAAVVTGAFGALGQAVAAALAQAGARVALLGHGKAAPPVAAQFGAPHMLLTAVELTNLSSTQAAMDAAQRGFGRIDILVNVAGAFRWEKIGSGIDRKSVV